MQGKKSKKRTITGKTNVSVKSLSQGKREKEGDTAKESLSPPLPLRRPKTADYRKERVKRVGTPLLPQRRREIENSFTAIGAEMEEGEEDQEEDKEREKALPTSKGENEERPASPAHLPLFSSSSLSSSFSLSTSNLPKEAMEIFNFDEKINGENEDPLTMPWEAKYMRMQKAQRELATALANKYPTSKDLFRKLDEGHRGRVSLSSLLHAAKKFGCPTRDLDLKLLFDQMIIERKEEKRREASGESRHEEGKRSRLGTIDIHAEEEHGLTFFELQNLCSPAYLEALSDSKAKQHRRKRLSNLVTNIEEKEEEREPKSPFPSPNQRDSTKRKGAEDEDEDEEDFILSPRTESTLNQTKEALISYIQLKLGGGGAEKGGGKNFGKLLTYAFRSLDADGNGYVTCEGLASSLGPKGFDLNVSPSAAWLLAQKADTNGDGIVSLKEFLSFLEVHMPEKDLKRSFEDSRQKDVEEYEKKLSSCQDPRKDTEESEIGEGVPSLSLSSPGKNEREKVGERAKPKKDEVRSMAGLIKEQLERTSAAVQTVQEREETEKRERESAELVDQKEAANVEELFHYLKVDKYRALPPLRPTSSPVRESRSERERQEKGDNVASSLGAFSLSSGKERELEYRRSPAFLSDKERYVTSHSISYLDPQSPIIGEREEKERERKKRTVEARGNRLAAYERDLKARGQLREEIKVYQENKRILAKLRQRENYLLLLRANTKKKDQTVGAETH